MNNATSALLVPALFLLAAASLACGPTVRQFGDGTTTGQGGSGASGSGSASAGGVGGTGGVGGVGSAGGAGGGPSLLRAATPLPPDAQHFMWQGVQSAFLTADYVPCDGHVAITAGDQAVCFVGADGYLRCAGRVYQTTFGASFVRVDQLGPVEQVLISPTVNSETGNGLCAVKRDKTVVCLGDFNSNGQFATGGKQPAAIPTQWGMAKGVSRIATGTWDQICAWSPDAPVLCSGYAIGLSPTPQGMGPAYGVWISTFGEIKRDDPQVFRASNGRTECQVKADGLRCSALPNPLGQPERVVDGTIFGGFGGPAGGGARACWLEDSGKVYCSTSSLKAPIFTGGLVLALAGLYYADTLCAVYNDGSVWCMGKNDHGQLGTGDMNSLLSEKQVAPPGSVDVSCTRHN
jgi:Regulator of chromosome condensation (RCC1) repeat